MITQDLPHLKNVKLKYKQNKYPQCNDPDGYLPRNYSVAIWAGSRGSGKTYLFCQLMKLYEKYGFYLDGEKVDQKIILISPTYDANPVFTSLKYLDRKDVYEEYSDDILQHILDDLKYEKDETDQYKKQLLVWNKFVRARNINTLSAEDLMELELMGYEKPLPPRYPNGVVNTLVIDDMVGSSIYKSSGKSLFTKTCIKNRHVNLNVHMMAQSIKGIPKTIRTNTSLFVIFKFASSKIVLEDIYPEIGGYITMEDFEDFFAYATSEDHGCLTIDFSQRKERMFKCGFHQILSKNISN